MKKKFEPIPAGDYLVRMNHFEEGVTKTDGSSKIKASFQVINGDHKKRLIFMDYLVGHSKDKVAEIAKSKLNKLLEATGVHESLDAIDYDYTKLEDVLEMPFVAEIVVDEERAYVDKDGNQRTSAARNSIKSYKKR